MTLFGGTGEEFFSTCMPMHYSGSRRFLLPPDVDIYNLYPLADSPDNFRRKILTTLAQNTQTRFGF